MNDRASVMKSFDRQFDEQRKQVLNTEESLQFLHSNAHFLLGLSSEAEKVVKDITKGSKVVVLGNPLLLWLMKPFSDSGRLSQ